MTTREGLVLATELFGDGMVSTFERLEAARRNLPAPQASMSLVEEVAVLGSVPETSSPTSAPGVDSGPRD